MPIEDPIATVLFNAVATTLEQNHLRWVVEQVNDHIAEGKPLTKSVRVLESRKTHDGEEVLRAGRTAEFRASVEYTPTERLILLLNATKQAVVVTAEIERSVHKQFPNAKFISERGEVELTVWEIGHRDKQIGSLKATLDALIERSR